MPHVTRSRVPADRRLLVIGLGRFLESAYYPRLGLLLIMSVAGVGGFLTSATLLSGGWVGMASRYAVAAGVAYALFLALIRLWARHYRDLYPDDLTQMPDVVGSVLPTAPDAPSFGFGDGEGFAGGGAARTFEGSLAPDDNGGLTSTLADLSVTDVDDGVVWLAPVILFTTLIAGLIGTIVVIGAAPTLLGEVLLDLGLAGVLYRRIHRVPPQHWLTGVVRRTWKPMLAITLCLVLTAALAQFLQPSADSIGDFFE